MKQKKQMRIRKILMLWGLFFAQMLAAQNVEERFEVELSQKSRTIKNIICDFTQTRSMSVLAEDIVKRGKFTYLRPGNILLSFDDGDYIKMTDLRFTMQSAGVHTDIKVNSNPVLKELRKILSACMTGDIEAMSSGFSMKVAENKDFYEVMLIPLKGRGSVRMKHIFMVFDKLHMSLVTLCLTELSGDGFRYDFTNKKFDTELPADLF